MDALCGPDGVDDNREKGVVGQRIASGQQEAGREGKVPGRGMILHRRPSHLFPLAKLYFSITFLVVHSTFECVMV